MCINGFSTFSYIHYFLYYISLPSIFIQHFPSAPEAATTPRIVPAKTAGVHVVLQYLRNEEFYMS